MVDRIIVFPEDVNVLISGICEYVTLCDKRLRSLEWRDYPGLSRKVQYNFL